MRWPILSGGGDRRPHRSDSSQAGLNGLLFIVLLSGRSAAEWQIKEVAFLNRGMYWTMGYVVPYRPHPDSNSLIVFRGAIPGAYNGIYFYTYAPTNRYVLTKADTGNAGDGLIPGNLVPWAAGDVDGDSVQELVGLNGEGYPDIFYLLATAYAPPTGSTCPDSLVWRGRYDSLIVYGCEPFYITDLDQDGKKEITFREDMRGGCIFVYEAVRDDSLRRVALIPCPYGWALADGDFDSDGVTEFATAGSDRNNRVTIFKCTGDNQCIRWDSVAIDRPNGQDVFTAANLDGSHRPVFFVGFWSMSGVTWLYQFEPTQGTRGYQAFLVDSAHFSSAPLDGRSVCGDVDGDGLDEVIWSCGTQLQMYRCTGPHQFEQVWYWWNQGSGSANVNLYDVNGNGYKEILMSGGGRTFIFEIEAVRLLQPNGGECLRAGDTHYIKWETYAPPRCDSLSVWFSPDSGRSCYLLARGLPPSAESIPWCVPDVRSDSCLVRVVAYGPGRQFDECDLLFHVLPAGVEECAVPGSGITGLARVVPNPLRGATSIHFTLRDAVQVRIRVCDAAGRTIAVIRNEMLRPGCHNAVWDASGLPEGIYFLNFTAGGCRETCKLVVTGTGQD